MRVVVRKQKDMNIVYERSPVWKNLFIWVFFFIQLGGNIYLSKVDSNYHAFAHNHWWMGFVLGVYLMCFSIWIANMIFD